MKNRVIAENQQIVRIDYEEVVPIPEQLEQKVIDSLPELMKDVKVIAISDYGKGFLSKTLLSATIEMAKARGIAIIADPKGTDFSKYTGVNVLKPNLSEAIAAAGLGHDASLENVSAKVLNHVLADTLMITRSEAGISLFHRDGKRQDFPVHIREVKDVTGAGDTSIGDVHCAMANGLNIGEATQLSNIAAGIAIERFGCARISLSDLARRLLELDVANKVFDDKHLFALQEAIKDKFCVLLGLSGSQGLTSCIFSSIRKLAQKQDWNVLVYIKDKHPNEEFIKILSSLHDVHFVVLNSDSLRALCNLIEPDEVYVIEDDKLVQLDHQSDLLQIS